MYKFHIRAYTVLSLTITCFGILAGFNALSMFWLNQPGKLQDFSISSSTHTHSNYGKNLHYALFSFNLTLDLTPEINWNTKQAFVYIRINYLYHNKPQSKIIWDTIVTRTDNWHLQLSEDIDGVSHFPLVLHQPSMNKDFTASVHWDISPYAGLLYRRNADVSIPVSVNK
ncbi:hypothetical protein GEMRC1_008620 [Eukaryota sp. GEM-RC1]